MAVAIRLQRRGATKKPYYKVVVLDREDKRDRSYLDLIGEYQPRAKDPSKVFFINKERLEYCVKNGALVSETV